MVRFHPRLPFDSPAVRLARTAGSLMASQHRENALSERSESKGSLRSVTILVAYLPERTSAAKPDTRQHVGGEPLKIGPTTGAPDRRCQPDCGCNRVQRAMASIVISPGARL